MHLKVVLLISFQMVSAPLNAGVGEKEEFSPSSHLMKVMAKSEAESFYQLTKETIKAMESEGIEKFMLNSGIINTEEDKKAVKSLASKAPANPIKLIEKSPGEWHASVKGHTVIMKLADLYEGRLWINGKAFVFKDIPLSKLEKELLLFEVPVKTSLLNRLFDKTLGMESAKAALLVPIIGIAGLILMGIAVYTLKYRPEQAVKKLNAIKAQIEDNAATCDESKGNEYNYSKTFDLASSVGERTTLNSMTSGSAALEFTIQRQLTSGSRSNDDCYRAMHEAGKKIDIDVPLITAQQHEKMELLGGGGKARKKTDVPGALYDLCQSYNKLSSCMTTFIQAHVDNSDINNFKNIAEKDHLKFKRAVGAIGQ